MASLLLLMVSFGILPFLPGCASVMPPDHKRQEIVYEDGKLQKFSFLGDSYGPRQETGASDFMEAVDFLQKFDPKALPELEDLPSVKPRRNLRVRKYTGLIQNFTHYDISIPSANSGVAIIVPAHGWREFISWTSQVRLSGFVNGKQVYYQSIRVQPKHFKYMGNTYDFVAEIQPPPEPAPEEKFSGPPKRKSKKRAKKTATPT